MGETWIDIEGYEKYYQVSSLRNIKSLERYVVNNRNGGKRKVKERILKPWIINRNYYAVTLQDISGKGKKNFLVHRLFAIAFIPNPHNLPCINHIDGNKLNNNIENLEWVTVGENNQHAYDTGLKIGAMKGRFGKDNPGSISVYKCDKITDEILAEYGSMNEAERETGVANSSICAACKGRLKTAGGYIWKYV